MKFTSFSNSIMSEEKRLLMSVYFDSQKRTKMYAFERQRKRDGSTSPLLKSFQQLSLGQTEARSLEL